MDSETLEQLKKIEEKIEATYLATEKTRKYMLWSFIVQLAFVLLPLLGLMIAVPFLLNTLSGLYQGVL